MFVKFCSIFNEILCLDLLLKHSRSVQHQACRLLTSGGENGFYKVKDIVKFWNAEFKNNKISEPFQSIKIILASVLQLQKLSDISKLKNKILTESEVDHIDNMCRKRLERMPLQYIIGEWDFRDLTIEIVPPILIPRPETEQLVDIVCDEINNQKYSKILEIGCGSGVISLSILKELPQLQVVAIDQNEKACELTKLNASKNNIFSNLKVLNYKLTNENYNSLFDHKFDLIVSNPPYVPTRRLNKLQPEVFLYEDHDALNGGEDGLDIIKLILKMAPIVLNENGKIILEVDFTQPELIKEYLEKYNSNLVYLRCYKDLFGKSRFVEIMLKPS